MNYLVVALNVLGLYAGWELEFRLPITAAVENIKLNLRTNLEIYSSAGTEEGICN